MPGPVSFSVVAVGSQVDVTGPFGRLARLLLLIDGSKGSHRWMTHVGIWESCGQTGKSDRDGNQF